MRQFKETFVSEVEKSELDMDFPFYTGERDEYEDEVHNEVETYDEVWSNSPSMDIVEAINILVKMNQKGANRVYIGDHADHRGYVFVGVKLEEIK